MAERLNTAFAAFDQEEGRRLREQWETNVATANLAEDNPIRQMAAPALAWLAEQDRREEQLRKVDAALLALQAALKADVPAAELECAYETAIHLEADTYPPALENAYQMRLAEFDAQQQRQRRRAFGGAISLLTLLSVIAAGAIYIHLRRNDIAGAYGRLAGFGRQSPT